MHCFLLGPSGVGKTRFANWLRANRGYLHIPIDRGDQGNGLIEEGLVDLWKELNDGNPAPFARELNKRANAAKKTSCVLDFWSVCFFDRKNIDDVAKHGIAIRYLYGPKENCIRAFVDRETKNNHPDRDRTFWFTYNTLYDKMGGSDLDLYRVNVFKPSGKRLRGKQIADILEIE
jgi:hypothetical protein